MKPNYFHYWISALLALAVLPLLATLHLPTNFAWLDLSTAYWLVLAAHSILLAGILFVIGKPGPAALADLSERYRQEPFRIALILLFFVVLGFALTWTKAILITIDTVAVLEFRECQDKNLRPSVVAVLLPALYFFAGFLLVLAYNIIIASVRFNFAYDPAFYSIDKWLLHGGSVSGMSHWAVQKLPLSFFKFLEFIYFGMFPQIGAGMILIGLSEGKGRSLQFVGTILFSYYLALGLFYLWPSQGPYYLCPAHFSRFPGALQTYSIQQFLIAHATALWNHVPIRRISTDYFIAFPCMHIAQPLVVIWFLRRWKRMVMVLCLYDAVLILSILLLEWHYVIDLVGGAAVAAISIAVNDSGGFREFCSQHFRPQRRRSALDREGKFAIG